MKKSMLVLAALTAFAGAASAQSSVTLFGIIDVNARNVDNGTSGRLRTLSTAGLNTPRLGFRGIEDLGGGLRAGFWLEGEVAPDTGGGQKATAPSPNGVGASGMDWQRRATVSLIGNFGEIRLGRDEVPTFKNWGAEPFNTVGVASGYNLRSLTLNRLAVAGDPRSFTTSGVTTGVRASNAIGYVLPAMGGLFGQAMVAAGEGTTGNKYVGARLGYAAGPISVAGAYGKTYQTGTMVDDYKVYNVNGSFNAGFMTVAVVYEKSEYFGNDQKILSVPVTVPLGAGTFKVQYTRSKGSSNFYEASMIGASYVYDLSKRTALYVSGGRVRNDGTAAVGANFTASNGGTAIVRGQDSTGYELGVRHSF